MAAGIWRLSGTIRSYAWGSREAIPALLGREPGPEPQAELWLGAHPAAPSELLLDDGRRVALDAWIRRDPDAVLGRATAERFGAELPFLLKVLAAAEPLSIQAHPDPDQARAGFERENARGVPLDAAQRCYRDPHHKPELISALTPFRALNRFREPEEIVRAVEALGVPDLEPILAPLRAQGGQEGLRAFFGDWMTLDPGSRSETVARVARAARARSGDPLCAEVVRLAERHPGDAGVLAPFFLNLVELAPGEAMYLPAGELHSYLGGVGIEIMASSDNVLRGGLTSKHVDVAELLHTLSFRSGPVDVLTPQPQQGGEARYQTPAAEFVLGRIDLAPGQSWAAPAGHGAEILLCTAGQGRITGEGGQRFRRGDALFAEASASGYRLEAVGETGTTLYRASVPAGAQA